MGGTPQKKIERCHRKQTWGATSLLETIEVRVFDREEADEDEIARGPEDDALDLKRK